MTRALFLASALIVSGCSSSRPQSEIDRGRQAVTAALESWKNNDRPDKLKSLPEPVDFSEELRANFALVNYSLGKVDSTDPDVIRFTVALTLKDKKGKVSEREAVYAVSFRSPKSPTSPTSPIVVARDPYY
jgi:hypothetical protein